VLLRRAWYRLNQAFRRRIASHGVTPDQFTVLRTLMEQDARGIIQSELTQIMSSDPNTIASLIERMEKAGWLEKKPHESDRRAHRIRLLPAGKKKYNDIRVLAVELQGEVLAILPEERRENFLEELAMVADACSDAVERSPRRVSRPK
jgi:DNA-binding MarR family transcriptional regulator